MPPAAGEYKGSGGPPGKDHKRDPGGEDPYKLLLMALDCVSRMTGDRAFYEQNKAQLHQADKK